MKGAGASDHFVKNIGTVFFQGRMTCSFFNRVRLGCKAAGLFIIDGANNSLYFFTTTKESVLVKLLINSYKIITPAITAEIIPTQIHVAKQATIIKTGIAKWGTSNKRNL